MQCIVQVIKRCGHSLFYIPVAFISFCTLGVMVSASSFCSSRLILDLGYGFFSKKVLASLIFAARYGLPPRSGWFITMSPRCFLRISSFVTPLSLCQKSAFVLGLPMICPLWKNVRDFEYEGGLSSIHYRFKTAFIKASSQSSTARSAQCD